MKEFSCGDVVPGCTAHFSAATDDEILTAVGQHAQRDHGMTEVTSALIDAVRANIQTLAA